MSLWRCPILCGNSWFEVVNSRGDAMKPAVLALGGNRAAKSKHKKGSHNPVAAFCLCVAGYRNM